MSEAEKNSYSLKGKIELIEPLGSKTNLHLNTGKHKFIVEINFLNHFREEEEIELVMDYNKMYVFNSQDGARIV
jgi:ABC-type sugar transport system ATPase subunit